MDIKQNCIAACVIASVLLGCNAEALNVDDFAPQKLKRLADSDDIGTLKRFFNDLKGYSKNTGKETYVDEAIRIAEGFTEEEIEALNTALIKQGKVEPNSQKSRMFCEILLKYISLTRPKESTQGTEPPQTPGTTTTPSVAPENLSLREKINIYKSRTKS
jgi:hypothetical protein